MAALDDDGISTKLGKLRNEFALDPQMSIMLVVSPDFNCSDEILSITAMLFDMALFPTVNEVVVLQTRLSPMFSARTPEFQSERCCILTDNLGYTCSICSICRVVGLLLKSDNNILFNFMCIIYTSS
jgi:HrpA-like RNA helicase